MLFRSGYFLDAPELTFKFVYQDGDTPVIELEHTFQNDGTSFYVSKRQLTGDDELPGATLTISDKDGNVVRQWVSGDKPQEIRGLAFGQVYTLSEQSAPDGYTIAESIRFKLVQRKDENGDLLNAADVYVCTGKDWLIFDHWEKMEDGTVIMRDALAPETPNQPTPAPTPTTTTVTATATPKPVAHVPQTGDNTPLLAMVIATALAAVGFVALLVMRCRRNRLEEETDPQLEPRDDPEETHE